MMMLLMLFMFSAVSVSGAAPAAVPGLQLSGSAELGVGFSFGDSGSGFELLQRVALKVDGQVTPTVSVSGNIDNTRDGNFQLMEVSLDGKVLDARFGSLSFRSQSPYTAYTGRLKGIWAGLELPKLRVDVTVGRVQGVAARKAFRGSTAQQTITYAEGGTYAPSADGQGLTADVSGMEFWVLPGALDPDFMGAWFVYADEVGGASLADTLEAWKLGYLTDIITTGQTEMLSAGQYAAVVTDDDMLALRVEARALVRSHVRAWIRSYNVANSLQGSDAMAYPFVDGSEAESLFLESLLSAHARIVAGTSADSPTALLDAAVASYATGRLYDLGQKEVLPGSVAVQLGVAGAFVSADVEPGVTHQIVYEQGIADFQFPAGLFDVYDSLRVSYSHEVDSGIIHLGISVAQYSERVYLNGQLLKADEDYFIDYELGLLTLAQPIGPDDDVVVEYEYFRGPFGAVSYYKSNFAGASVQWTPADRLKLAAEAVRYADDGRTTAHPAATPVMPNSHTVVGLSARYSGQALTIGGDAAYSVEEFPFGANRKPNAANSISSIMAAADSDGGAYLVVGHGDGINVGAEGFATMTHYGQGQGPAGASVKALANEGSTWFLAGAGGLAVVEAEVIGGGGPLDMAANWRRFYVTDGLPAADLTAVAATPWLAWTGSSGSGLSWAYRDDLSSWTRVTASASTGLPSDDIVAMAYDALDDVLLVATGSGLATIDGGGAGTFVTELASGERVTAVAVAAAGAAPIGGDPTLRTFASTPGGVYYRQSGGGWILVTADERVAGAAALAAWDGLLWIGTTEGLFTWDGSGTSVAAVAGAEGVSVGAIAAGPGLAYAGESLWASVGADLLEVATASAYQLHAAVEVGVPAEDPRQYVDLDAADNTVRGAAARADASYKFGAQGTNSVYAGAEHADEGFSRLGQTTRQGVDSWRVGAAVWPIPQLLNLTAEHSEASIETSGGSAEPKVVTTVVNRVGAGAELGRGPTVDVSYRTSAVESVGGAAADSSRFDRTVSVSAKQSLFDGKLTMGAGYDYTTSEEGAGAGASAAATIATAIRGDAALRLNDITLSVRYRRPVRTVGVGTVDERTAGVDELTLNAAWAVQLGAVGLRASYRQVDKLDIATDRRLDDKRAEVRATLPSLQLGQAASFTPSLTAKWESFTPFSGQPRQVVGASAALNGSIGRFRTSTGGAVGLTQYATTAAKSSLDWSAFASLSGGASAGAQFVPQADVKWSRTTATRGDLGSTSSDRLTANLRGTWTPRQGLSDVTVASYTMTATDGPVPAERHSLSLSNTLSMRLNQKLSVSADASVRAGARALVKLFAPGEAGIVASAGVGLDYAITEVWAVKLAGGYKGTLVPEGTGGLKSDFTLDLGLRASF